jgi:hypothetical protein
MTVSNILCDSQQPISVAAQHLEVRAARASADGIFSSGNEASLEMIWEN